MLQRLYDIVQDTQLLELHNDPPYPKAALKKVPILCLTLVRLTVLAFAGQIGLTQASHFSCRPHVAQLLSSVDNRFIERLIKWVSKPDHTPPVPFLSFSFLRCPEGDGAHSSA